MKSFALVRVLILTALILGLARPGAARAQAACPPGSLYTVQRGDTLSGIARRQSTSVSELVRLNHLSDPNRLFAGQVLVLPGGEGCQVQPAGLASPPAPPASAAQVYIVQRGDTLTRIAARYATTVSALAAANGITNAARIYAGQALTIPGAEVTAVPASAPASIASLAPAMPEQGRTVRISVPAANVASVTGALGDWPLRFFREGDKYVCLLGIDAFAPPGAYQLTLTLADSAGAVSTVSQPVTVVTGGYGSERLTLNAEKSALLDPALVAAERAQIAAVIALATPARYWQGVFQLPAAGRVTSWFGTRRSYNGGPFGSYHDGVDFSAAGGPNVRSPAAGVVVFAQPLTVRGNVTLIDHGWGVYSGFWHQSAWTVKAGDVVQAGQIIGLIGNTGLSTGAHLHWAVFVGGVPVDPLQWTRQTFP